ncbi:hypothetical protein CN907_26870 [Bacillus anthracis]|nr:hypothetical protein CN907_26870 [Bacillus anthracis]
MPSSISGTVFNDLNGNGILNPGEPGIPNVFVGGILQPGANPNAGIDIETLAVSETRTVQFNVKDVGN